MDKATEIARQINYMCFSGFEKSDFDQETCANLIRLHLEQAYKDGLRDCLINEARQLHPMTLDGTNNPEAPQ